MHVLPSRAVVSAAALVLAAAVVSVGGEAIAASHAPRAAPAPAAGGITPLPATAAWRTVFTGNMTGIEGMTGDSHGNLYFAERSATANCPVFKVVAATGATTQIGFVPAPCTPSGLAFGPDHRLYISGADAPALDQIDVLTPGTATTAATEFATGAPQANGLAFDSHGNLWASDGLNNQGIVYRIGRNGGAATEAFRVPAMTNSLGVGRENVALGGDTPNTGTAVNITANGIQFTSDGTMIIADTARGALWEVHLNSQGKVTSPMGCDSTYLPDTLCLSDVFTQSPYLEGADGIVLDTAGRIWVDANERQAIIVVGRDGRAEEFFRNPVASTGRRNAGPLEFPTSPVLTGHELCTSDNDVDRRDNSPNSGGEVTGTGKVSCLDQPVDATGVSLPVR